MIESADPLIRWASGARDARRWERAGAVVIACPGLSHWDRLVIDGEPAAVADLLRVVLAETGETFRPFGTEELVTDVVARLPELEVSARFAWMETTAPAERTGTAGLRERARVTVPVEQAGTAGLRERAQATAPVERVETARLGERVEATPSGNKVQTGGIAAAEGGEPAWLEEDAAPEIAELIKEAYPESYAQPGDPDVRRWAGIRDADGSLVTIAAEAWSTPEIGFMAGVTTRPSARGRGLGAKICAFTANELLQGRERVALLVDYWNTAAVATYTRLGFTTRRVAAARRS